MDKINMNIDSSISSEKPSVFERLPFWLLSTLLVLIPLFIIPSVNIDFLFGKALLLTIVVVVSLVISIFSIIRSGKISIPGWKALVLFSLVPISTIVSAFLSIHRPTSFIGIGYEFDTVHFVGLGFLLVALVAANFQSKQRIFFSYVVILGTFVLVSLFHVIRFIFGAPVLNPGGLFTSLIANTVGTWSDLGIYAGLAIILSFVTIELVDIGKKMKFAFYVALVLGLALLTVTNFYVITGFLGLNIPLTAFVGLAALFVFVYIISLNYKSSKKMPMASLIVLVFCIVMTVGAGPIATFINGSIGITQNDVLDVRPTISGTQTVATDLITRGGSVRAIFGVGPNRFSAAWAMFKPATVNQTVFWNTDFNYGTGYISTVIVTTGILGLISWILFLLGTFIAGTRSVFATKKDRFSMYLTASSLLASLYLWLIAIFAITTSTILILAFFSTGLLVASLIREKSISVKEYSWTSSQKKGFIAVFLLIIILIATVAWAFAWVEHLVASFEVNKASFVLKAPENIPQAEALLVSAIRRVPTSDIYLRAYSQLKIVELQASFQKSGKNEITKDNQIILEQAVLAAEAAVRQNPSDYHNFIFLGQVYQTAGLLGVEKAGDAALNAYREAYKFIPSSPLPGYLAGYLYALAKDSTNAKAALEQSLQMKPDFEEAYTLYSEISGANPGAQSVVSDDVQTSSSPAAVKKTTATSTSATSTKAR